MAFNLRVNSPKGEEEIIRLCNCNDRLKNITVRQLKEIVQCTLEIVDKVELVFGIETLSEDELLLSYGIRHMSRIYTVVKLPGAHLMKRSGHTETNMMPNFTSSL